MSATVVNTPQETLTYRFRYDGVSRIVDNVEFEGDRQQFIGMEIRKAGKFSFRIKRFTLSKVEGGLERVEPIHRSGPVLGRP